MWLGMKVHNVALELTAWGPAGSAYTRCFTELWILVRRSHSVPRYVPKIVSVVIPRLTREVTIAHHVAEGYKNKQ